MPDPVATTTETPVADVTSPLTKAADALVAAAGTLEKAYKDRPGNRDHVTAAINGRIPGDSEGYSFFKACAVSKGMISPEEAKLELDVSAKMAEMYGSSFTPSTQFQSMLVPVCTRAFPRTHKSFANEIREMVYAGVEGADPDEARWLAKRLNITKTSGFGTLSDIAGGSLTSFPALGELIELQRNLEVFANCGASEVSLPPNGRIAYPKQTGGATAYWVGEEAAITTSLPATGTLNLEAKKLGVAVILNNELIRYAGPMSEALTRMDMARQAALAADLAMLQGTGGTSIKGIIKYATSTSWTAGAADNLLSFPASKAGTNGDTFQAQDVFLMEGKLPDVVPGPTAYVMRKDMFSYLATRRADSVAAGDQAGPYVNNITRQLQDGLTIMANGTKVVRSSQVSNARTKGSATNLSFILAGYFPDWLIGRSGVMELVMNPYFGSTASTAGFLADQTVLRGIQHIDAGARHAASFVLCDQLVIA